MGTKEEDYIQIRLAIGDLELPAKEIAALAGLPNLVATKRGERNKERIIPRRSSIVSSVELFMEDKGFREFVDDFVETQKCFADQVSPYVGRIIEISESADLEFEFVVFGSTAIREFSMSKNSIELAGKLGVGISVFSYQ